jgi:hypothetical protein
MKITLANITLIMLISFSKSALAEEENLDGEFLEFLAELENIDNAWTHPVDFEGSMSGSSRSEWSLVEPGTTVKGNDTLNKITASETNDE